MQASTKKTRRGYQKQLRQLERSASFQEVRLLLVGLSFAAFFLLYPIFAYVDAHGPSPNEAVAQLFSSVTEIRETFFGMILWGLLIGGAATSSMVRRLWRTYGHIDRITKAQRLLERTQSGRSEFTLYLRPFSIDALTIEVERRIEEFGHATIALGNPFAEEFEDKNISKVWADDSEWQLIVSPLLIRANAIVVHPSAQDGTRWELEALFGSHELGARSYLVVPPSRNFEMVRHYNAARKIFDTHGRWPTPGDAVSIVSLADLTA